MYLTVCNKQTFKFGEIPSIVVKSSAKKSDTKITRIKASDSGASTAATEVPAASTPTKVTRDKKTNKSKAGDPSAKKEHRNIFVRIGRYFKGAWSELRQVRWPDRKATWGMTGALIAFTLFFVVVIILLDDAFGQLFNLIIGSK